MSELKIKPCPFCGGEIKFHKISSVDEYGEEFTLQYYRHADMEQDCVLNAIYFPFTIGAGDADEETGYIGELAEKWNKRVKDGEE